jgi:general secretion pathway protein K
MTVSSLKPRRGSVLLAVLFVSTVLSALLLSGAYRAALVARSVRDRELELRLKAQAQSAVAIAISRLAQNNNSFDALAESWRLHGPLAAEGLLEDWDPRADGGKKFQADYVVIDEEGKLNVAFASSTALQKLGLSNSQIASLLDWVDEDNFPRAEGAENDFYLAQHNPHRCKNAPMDLLDELLLIRDFTPSAYRGPDLFAGEQGHDSAHSDAATPAAGCVNLLTTAGDGRININTAPLAVLKTLPLSDGAAEQIERFRQFDPQNSSGKMEDHVFRSPEDIRQLQGLTDADRDVLEAMAIFRSTQFRIRAGALHRPSGQRCELEVLVDCAHGPPQIMQWREVP